MTATLVSVSHAQTSGPRRALWLKWTIATTLGELIGFAVPAMILPLLLVFGMPESLMPAAAVIIGAGEGASLAIAQWLVLRRYVIGLSRNAWVVATVLAAMWAYALAMVATQIIDWSALDAVVVLIGAIGLGTLFVLSIGGAQWLVLRRHLDGSAWWILGNAIAWPLGVAMPFITLALVPDAAPVALTIVAGILGGLLMGIVVGAITGLVLVWVLAHQGYKRKPVSSL